MTKAKTELCSIDGCNQPHMARGLCMRHWKRLRRHGDPLQRLTRKHPTLDELVKSESEQCILWTGMVRTDGYGCLTIDGKLIAAHRASYERFIGKIPDGMLVCHKCDNPLCVNPGHLFLGTHKDNTADMMAKGRNRHGNGVGTSKLTDDAVRAIREDTRGPSELARAIGVSKATISKIKNGKAWTHVL